MKPESQTAKKDRIAVIALIIGIAALIVFGIGILIGILVESIGITSFLNIVLILGLAAIICGFSVIKKQEAKKIAVWGIVLGCCALFLSLLARVAIFIFFIPWLGA